MKSKYLLITVTILLAVLLLGLTWFIKPDRKQRVIRKPDGYQVIHFDSSHSLGDLLMRNSGTDDPWEPLGSAQGPVTIPAGKELNLSIIPRKVLDLKRLNKFEISYHSVTDLGPLADLDPNLFFAISYQGETTDSDLGHIQNLTGLRSLFFHGHPSGITDAGLAKLTGMKQLETLFLEGASITDAGIVHLKSLPSLRELSLWSTQISDAGLYQLSSMDSLVDLAVYNTKITNKGIRHLSKLPALEVLRYGGAKVDDDSFKHLISYPNLKELEVVVPITEKGMSYLAKIKTLESFRPRCDSLDDNLMRILSTLPALKRLYLTHTQVNASSLQHLAKLETLQFLFLGVDTTEDHLRYLSFPRRIPVSRNDHRLLWECIPA